MYVNSITTTQREWQENQEPNLRQLLKAAAEVASVEQPENQELKYILKSTAERQLDYGLSECRNLKFIESTEDPQRIIPRIFPSIR